MTYPKIVLAKLGHSTQSKSFRTNAALLFAALTLLVAAATSVATAQTYTDLYDFDGIHGSRPLGFLAQGRGGNLLGTTWFGGTYGHGVVFRITPDGTQTVLHNFSYSEVGGDSAIGLTLGLDGYFYGITEEDGANGLGSIFKIAPHGSLTFLHYFNGVTDGSFPSAPPIEGADGDFYGVTAHGTAYKMTPWGAVTPFGSIPGQPAIAPLLEGRDGNFYGTTEAGGSSGNGTVFRITPEGIVTVVYDFDGVHGAAPQSNVIQGRDGNLYGTTAGGGSYGWGAVFKLTLHGAITVLHNFPDPNYPGDASQPWAGLLQATDGNFYGEVGNSDRGVIYRITPAGDYSILYAFDEVHGDYPTSILVQHTSGKIYGLALYGGANLDGAVFSFDVGLGPFVKTLPTLGKAGSNVEILGQGFTGTTAVTFNGTPASFRVPEDTYLTATVPNGATTGFVRVTTPGGALTSNEKFRVRPVILGLSLTSGAAGTPVVITGTSFSQTTKVTFGGGKAAATFTVDSDTQVTATVPAGAPTGYIVLTTAGGKSRSPDTFTVTP